MFGLGIIFPSEWSNFHSFFLNWWNTVSNCKTYVCDSVRNDLFCGLFYHDHNCILNCTCFNVKKQSKSWSLRLFHPQNEFFSPWCHSKSANFFLFFMENVQFFHTVKVNGKFDVWSPDISKNQLCWCHLHQTWYIIMHYMSTNLRTTAETTHYLINLLYTVISTKISHITSEDLEYSTQVIRTTVFLELDSPVHFHCM